MMRIGQGGGILAASVALVLACTPVWAEDGKNAPPSNQGPLWTKQCVKNPSGKDICFVQQFAIAVPQNAPVLNVSLGYLGPQGKLRLILRTPLGIFLPPGLQGTIDHGKPFTLPLESCDQNGCRTGVDMDQASADQIRGGRVLTVQYITVDRKAVDIPIKLDGLSAALGTLKQ